MRLRHGNRLLSGLFPQGASREFDISLRKVCDLLGVKLLEVADWTCCGTSPAHAMSEELSYLLPYENIRKAVEQGLKELLVPCPSCLYSLSYTEKMYMQHRMVRSRLAEAAGYSYAGGLKIYHILDFFRDVITLETLKKSAKRPLEGWKIASYYGCLTRFHGVEIDDPERPAVMEQVVEALGAEALKWTHKVECCGASLSITRPDITERLIKGIFDSAKEAGADCIAVVCPLCQSNLDIRQKGLKDASGKPYDIPILYLTQLMGIAFGARLDDLGMEKLMVDPFPLLKEKATFSQANVG